MFPAQLLMRFRVLQTRLRRGFHFSTLPTHLLEPVDCAMERELKLPKVALIRNIN